MWLHECLKQLPPDLLMIDIAAVQNKRKTVRQLLETVADEPGFELRQEASYYGRKVNWVVGLEGSLTVFREA